MVASIITEKIQEQERRIDHLTQVIEAAHKEIADAEQKKALWKELLEEVPEEPVVAEVVHCVACDAVTTDCVAADEVHEISYGVGA